MCALACDCPNVTHALLMFSTYGELESKMLGGWGRCRFLETILSFSLGHEPNSMVWNSTEMILWDDLPHLANCAFHYPLVQFIFSWQGLVTCGQASSNMARARPFPLLDCPRKTRKLASECRRYHFTWWTDSSFAVCPAITLHPLWMK